MHFPFRAIAISEKLVEENWSAFQKAEVPLKKSFAEICGLKIPVQICRQNNDDNRIFARVYECLPSLVVKECALVCGRPIPLATTGHGSVAMRTKQKEHAEQARFYEYRKVLERFSAILGKVNFDFHGDVEDLDKPTANKHIPIAN